jgi:hypothetical protein
LRKQNIRARQRERARSRTSSSAAEFDVASVLRAASARNHAVAFANAKSAAMGCAATSVSAIPYFAVRPLEETKETREATKKSLKNIDFEGGRRPLLREI